MKKVFFVEIGGNSGVEIMECISWSPECTRSWIKRILGGPGEKDESDQFFGTGHMTED